VDIDQTKPVFSESIELPNFSCAQGATAIVIQSACGGFRCHNDFFCKKFNLIRPKLALGLLGLPVVISGIEFRADGCMLCAVQ
jgi:hypothetical protein